MIIVKLIVLVIAACIGGFSFGSLFNFAVACVAGFVLVGAVDPGWGRVTALLPPLAVYWLLSTFILPDIFRWQLSLFQLIALAFVFGVPLDAFPFDIPDQPKKKSHALAKRDDQILDAEIVDN